MSIQPGTRLGPYQIVAPIGAGGMGEVYRARDTKLNRDVAIKILPEIFTHDPDRLARFTREAQILAALNHTNIAQVHGLEALPNHASALVMELVEGEDLSELIARGPIPIADALPIARQIAEALETAHEQGIIHRDLKPANIKVKTDGTVKVLDFGLAKAMDPPSPEASAGKPGYAMNSPTFTSPAGRLRQGYGEPGLTEMGVILGTAAYMAPEQARGKLVDKRADIWAFGVVLYEMLTGSRIFEGESIPETLGLIFAREPDLVALPAGTSPQLRRLLARCLVKDPKQRLRDIGDARLMLDEKDEPAAPAASAGSVAAEPAWRRVVPVLVTAVATALVFLGIKVLSRPAATPPEIVRVTVVAEASAPFFHSPTGSDFALSQDGRLLVYLAARQGQPQLYARRLDQLSATPVAGLSENVRDVFLSADDQWIGFVEPGTGFLRKIRVSGGPSQILCRPGREVLGATWLADGTIVYGSNEGLRTVAESGGAPVPLTRLDSSRGDTSHRWPAAIPGTSAVLFVATSGDPLRTGHVAVLDRATGRVVRTTLTGTMPRYLSTGHILYSRGDGTLFVAPFDSRRLEVTGSPAALAEQVSAKGDGAASFAVAGDGRLAYSTFGWLNTDRAVVWVDRTGKESSTVAPPRAYYYARVSPDGTRLSFDVRDKDLDIWALDARGTLNRVTEGPAADQYGLWMPDGEHLVFSSFRGDKQGLYRGRVDGAGSPDLIVDAPGAYPNAVTPDGKQLIFRSAVAGKGGNDLFVVSVDGDHTVRSLLATQHDELNAAISPDGRWMAYQSDVSGLAEIYVRPFPDVNAGQVKVSLAGGVKPAWAPGGRELFYLTPNNTMMSVTVETARGFVPGPPVRLFDASPYFTQGAGRNYDVSRDATRFVMIRNPAIPTGSDAVIVVLNWAADLAARLAVAPR